MATTQECETALHELADKLATTGNATASKYERTLSCTLRDLDATFLGRLHDGNLVDIHREDGASAQIRLTLGSDDLLALVAGTLPMGSAVTTGRLKIKAGFRDLLVLRTLF